MRFLVAALVTFFMVNTVVFAAGDLTRQEPIEVTVELGTKNGEMIFVPSKLEFETGKLYKLILTNPSPVKHYFTSPEFAKRIFTRKVQVMIDGKRTAEIKGDIDEVEVFPGGTTEWWFVPVQTVEANDLHCYVKDKASGMRHNELGMKGTIILK
jgi:uncharacterized cupredoxin-like copper-binding protein